jgi:RsiW-degrading membrane proteinase PrsW (M82 family)
MATRPTSLWRSGGFWKAQRPAARARILGAVFFTFAVLGFVTDMWSLDPERPRWRVVVSAFYTGSIAAGFVYAIMVVRHTHMPTMS